jgi:hypothetical protein
VENNLSQSMNPARREVILFLGLLSSLDCQQALARSLSSETVTFELCRLWFDEIYSPGRSYLDGLKGDRSPDEIEQFWTGFTDDEQAALKRFHRFFELRMEMLPDEARARESFPENDLWISITRDASHLLETLGSDPERLQRHLTWIIHAATNDGHRADRLRRDV